jgi:hypothetical protein
MLGEPCDVRPRLVARQQLTHNVPLYPRKRTLGEGVTMSALPPIWDMDHHGRDVRFGSKADIGIRQSLSSATGGTLVDSLCAILVFDMPVEKFGSALDVERPSGMVHRY